MIIDIHTHAWPEKVASAAREHLEKIFREKFVGIPTLTTLAAFMRRNRITTSVICAVATKPEQTSSINDWLFSIRSRRFRVFAAMHPQYPLWHAELKRIRRFADGIKLQPEFQNFYIDDERLSPFYAAIEKYRIPLLFHCGKELSGTMLVRSSPKRMRSLLKRFPRLTVIGGHFGGFQLWDDVERYLLGEDVYLDTSFFFGHLPRERITRMILGHRRDRVLFGTDFPLVDQRRDLAYLASLDIPKELKGRILYGNARQILTKQA